MSKRILVVDDEAPIVSLLTEGLAAEGYSVEGAADAESALAKIKDQLYDAAIVDFNLPDMNGIMLHSRIRQMDAELARNTLFISGVAQREQDLSYYASLASGFIAKPFDLGEVVAAVRALVG